MSSKKGKKSKENKSKEPKKVPEAAKEKTPARPPKKETIKGLLLSSLLESRTKSYMTKNSFAKIEFNNSNSYTGWIDEDGFCGFGTYTFADGSSFKGTFEKSNIKGLGRLIYKNGDVYEGEFIGGQRHGYGQYKSREFQYNGQFKNGKFHGKGAFKTRLEEIEGVFQEGCIEHGQACSCVGSYVGTFKEQSFKKHGQFKFDNGNTYTGFWNENYFSDFGEYNWNIPGRQTKYIGFWENGVRHGLGVLKFDQRLIMCQWLHGKKDGAGVIIACNGTLFVGMNMFNNDQYKESKNIHNSVDSQMILTDILDILSPNSKIESVDGKIEHFHLSIEKLLSQYSNFCSPMYPLWIPNYEVPQLSFASDVEIRNLQQVLIENYSLFKNLYKKYTQPQNECMNALGLNLFYMDLFQEVRDANISDLLTLGDIYIHQCSFKDTSSDDLAGVTPFHEFFLHFVHCALLLMENATLATKITELKPVYFGNLAIKVLLLLKMLTEKGQPMFLVREGLASDYSNILQLINQVEGKSHGEKGFGSVFKYLRNKNIIKQDCFEFKEAIKKLFYGYDQLIGTQYRLSTLEQIEIILQTCKIKILYDVSQCLKPKK